MFFIKPTGSRLVDRGDPAQYDFTFVDFNKDGSWHDLDLSGIIPLNTKWIVFKCRIKASAMGNTLLFRKKGYTNVRTPVQFDVQAINNEIAATYLIPVSTDRMISYNCDVDYTVIDFVVCGWVL